MYTSFLNVYRQVILFEQNTCVNKSNHKRIQRKAACADKINFKLHMQTKQEPMHAMYTSLYKRYILIIFWKQVMDFSEMIVQEMKAHLNKTRIHAMYTLFLKICRRGIGFAQTTRINKTNHILAREIKRACNLN